MKTIFSALGLFFVLALTGQALATTVEGRVVGVSDGDTITVLSPDKQRIRVRLAEIDAPESSQAFGARSKKALSDICFGKIASINTKDTDRYGRVVSRVTCNGVDAQAHQVSGGMAWVFDRYVKDRSLYVLQTRARTERAGLWADASPVPPWEFRREARR